MKIQLNKQLILENSKYKSVQCEGIVGDSSGFSCAERTKRGKGIGEFFIHTHRARSKYYDDLGKVPKSAQKFITSTG